MDARSMPSRTVLAGYHEFTDRGRDTMISLESIQDGYHDGLGVWHPLSQRTRDLITAAMRGDGHGDRTDKDVRIASADDSRRLGPGEIVLEDGSRRSSADGGLPAGDHDYHPYSGGAPFRLIATPGRCPTPASRRWGLTVQLYAARSAASWGIGDLADLRTVADWAATLGASFLLLNPLAASLPTTPQQNSPYYPSSR